MNATEEKVMTVREALWDFIDDLYEREDEVDLRTLVAKVQGRFGDDAEFIDALVREAYAVIVQDVAHRVRHQRRASGGFNHEPDQTTRERLARIFAHVGENRHRSLLAMTPDQHVFAAEERERDARVNLCWANFHRAIAETHRNDDRTTGEVLSEGQLRRIYEQHIDCEDPRPYWLR